MRTQNQSGASTPKGWWLGWLAVGGLIGIAVASADRAEGRADAGIGEGLSGNLATNSPLKSLGSGRFGLGLVRFDKNRNRVTVPAVVNMGEGPIEYGLVSGTGKLHESLLRTEAKPYHLHVAALFLGVIAPGATKSKTGLEGVPVQISVSWTGGGEGHRLEDFIWDIEAKKVMSRDRWIYNGSQLIEGTFIAQRDGLFVAVMADPFALVNNPRNGRENDENWRVNATNLPPVGAAVEVTFEFEQKK